MSVVSRQTHIGQLYNPLLVYHYVLRLYVAVNQPHRMGVPQRLSHLYDDIQRLLLAENLARRQVLIQRLALDVFHYKVVIAARLADVHRLHDIGVIQLASRLTLFVKTLHVLLILSKPLRQNLNRHHPVQTKLPRLVNNRHRAGANLAQNLITGYLMGRRGPLGLPYRVLQPLHLRRR